MQYAIEMTWNICTYLVKLSNILLLARLFAHPSTPYFRVCLHIVHAFLLFWTTASFFSALFRCTPVNSFWDLNVQGSCPHIRAGRLIPAVLNSFTDVVLLSLPMRPVWQLQLPWRQKIAVLGMFCVGFLALAASATRLHYSVAVSGYHGHDPTCESCPLPFLCTSSFGAIQRARVLTKFRRCKCSSCPLGYC